jgi:hypothetical protein
MQLLQRNSYCTIKITIADNVSSFDENIGPRVDRMVLAHVAEAAVPRRELASIVRR